MKNKQQEKRFYSKRKFMLEARNEAMKAVKSGDGGPFGAIIVKNGKIISKAHNMVIALNDPTAHAEVLAIRKACQKLKSYSLTECEIFSSCEPCPMCLSAIYWARIPKLYYGCTRDDAEKIGFDDNFLYKIFLGKRTKKNIKKQKIYRREILKIFKSWENKKDKILY
ncbi:MAG TPA: nucleoside deaminase [Victivallales bacterium]|nr:nucleoside deaminase [Victivallales bacterium]HPO90879.1 nucleoside deaminase [Victivallales bacterium]HRR28108.1 nucleoside deaminase [Victivallales bacterium]HRU02403.1 nucleoside deaminase [Victivallales bacterium]